MPSVIKKSTKPKSVLQFDISIGGPSLTQKVLFAKNLAVMLRSGVTLVDALYTIQGSASGKLRTVLSSVVDKVESGVPLSGALAKYPKVFPEVFVNVTQAGEASGTLPENLDNIAKQLKKDKDLLTKIRGAMIYPVIILIATFLLGMAVAFFILPNIVPLFVGLDVELPITTRALIAFSEIVERHGLLLFGSIIVALVGFIWVVRQRFSQPVTHFLAIKLPIIKRITQYANVARFANMLGTSLKSGISIDEALEITRRSINNHYYRKELVRIERQVRAGAKLSDELLRAQTLFPAMVTRMLKVGEESGRFEETLLYLADFYEEEVNTSIKTLTTMLEPLLLLFIGGVVGFLALSIISPIYDITGNVQR